MSQLVPRVPFESSQLFSDISINYCAKNHFFPLLIVNTFIEIIKIDRTYYCSNISIIKGNSCCKFEQTGIWLCPHPILCSVKWELLPPTLYFTLDLWLSVDTSILVAFMCRWKNPLTSASRNNKKNMLYLQHIQFGSFSHRLLSPISYYMCSPQQDLAWKTFNYLLEHEVSRAVREQHPAARIQLQLRNIG